MNCIITYLRQKKKINGRRKMHSSLQSWSLPKTIVVVSIYNGKLRNSRPCNECIHIMRMYNIKNVIYSTGNPEEPYRKEEVSMMQFMYHSRGNKN